MKTNLLASIANNWTVLLDRIIPRKYEQVVNKARFKVGAQASGAAGQVAQHLPRISRGHRLENVVDIMDIHRAEWRIRTTNAERMFRKCLRIEGRLRKAIRT